MDNWRDVFGGMLVKVLAEHKEASIGVAGCWAKHINYPVCELDLIVISPKKESCFERRVEGDLIVDVKYVDQTYLSGQFEGELASSLSECIILQDPDLRLASLTSLLRDRSQRIRKNLAASALTNAVSYLGLSKRALKEGYNMSGGFWLLASGYSLLEVLIWRDGDTPRPSHLMSQFRASTSPYKQTLSSLLGLAEATATSLKRRLDFLSRCYEAEALGLLGRCRLESQLPTLATKKALYLLDANMVVDAYLYLGYLIVRVLKEMYKSETISSTKPKPHNFIEDVENRSVLGKGVVKLASFPSQDRALIEDIDKIVVKLAQSI